MTELDDLKEEARYVQRILKNVELLRKNVQQRAVQKMAKGEDVQEMLEVLQITKRYEDDE